MMPQDQIKLSRWLIGIAVTLLLFVATQTATGIWWASAITADMRYVREEITESKAERYSKAEAAKDKELYLAFIKSLEDRIKRLEDAKP
jgi:hypothetical protein